MPKKPSICIYIYN